VRLLLVLESGIEPDREELYPLHWAALRTTREQRSCSRSALPPISFVCM
jgi:hypothetical protein